MTDQTDQPSAIDDPGPTRVGMPRWVKVSLIVLGAVIALFIALQLAGVGGDHGPGRHLGPGGDGPSSDPGGHRPPAGIPNHGG